MIDTNAFSNLRKSIDNTIKALESIPVPRYRWMEALHPKKKPRGSIRRKRKGIESE